MSDQFTAAGYSATDIGWGSRPAVVAVDFQQAFCDPQYALGRSAHVTSAVANAAPVVRAARAAGVPVIHTAVAWDNDATFVKWKVPTLRLIEPGSHGAAITPSLWEDSDIYLLKRYPSAFFGTDLTTILRNLGVDTVLVMGVTTSGCVRATIVDSFSHGFRTIVVEDACGDQEADSHDANMRDVSRRYADLVSHTEAAERLATYA